MRPAIDLFRLSLIAIFVGIVTGFGAIAFRGLIGFIHNLLFLGHFSFFYDANSYTPPSPWGIFVIIVPVVGAVFVTLLVTKFAPEARGHGVPEVMDADRRSDKSYRWQPAFAIVGMAAMVGGGTGAAAVTMIFEMTRDYDIVMPMIIAVAVSIGIRRVLSHENIYTIKLVSRRHFIPKALHANMFLVHQARDVMDRDILLLPTDMSLDEFLRQPKHEGKIRHVVVVCDDRIVGVLRVNTGIRQGLESAYTGVRLHDVASRDFTVANEEDIMFGVIGRMWQRGAMMAVVVRGNGAPLAGDVLGVITKEHVADSVALSVRPYTSIDSKT